MDKNYLSESEARDLCKVLSFDESLILQMIKVLPASTIRERVGVRMMKFVPSKMEARAVHGSEAYQLADELIIKKDDIIKSILLIEKPKPRPVQYVSELLDYLNLRESSSHASSESLNSRIRELIDSIKTYIFGATPMCKAMNDALSVFKGAEAKSKVLFILSDGISTDGDSRPIA